MKASKRSRSQVKLQVLASACATFLYIDYGIAPGSIVGARAEQNEDLSAFHSESHHYQCPPPPRDGSLERR